MVEQIEMSKDRYKPEAAERPTLEHFRQSRLEYAERSLASAREYAAAEKARAEERAAWFAAIAATVPPLE